MFYGRILAAALAVAPFIPAAAQPAVNAEVVATCGTPNSTYQAGRPQPTTQNTSGEGCVSVTGTITPAPATGPVTQAAVSCAATNTTLLAAGAATKFITVQVPPTAAATVWVNVSGDAATTAAPNIGLQPGSSTTWGTSGFLPTEQLNCISTTGTISVSVLYN